MVAVEKETTTQLTVWIKALLGIKRKWFPYKDVADKQIISAGTGFTHGATGFIYKVLQGAANEARKAGLLKNPNPATKQTYSTSVGNTDRMMPSPDGWDQTQGILSRHIYNASNMLLNILRSRKSLPELARLRLTASCRTCEEFKTK